MSCLEFACVCVFIFFFSFLTLLALYLLRAASVKASLQTLVREVFPHSPCGKIEVKRLVQSCTVSYCRYKNRTEIFELLLLCFSYEKHHKAYYEVLLSYLKVMLDNIGSFWQV